MSKLLVDMAERKWIAENATKEVGSQVKFRVIDLDKIIPKMQQQRREQSLPPFVIIQPISVDQHKVPNRMPTFQKDPVTGVFYGILIGVDTFGNPKWQRPVIQDGLSLDMENVNDVKMWSVLRFHPDIEGSPFQSSNPLYKVWDPAQEAKASINKNIAMKEAFELVDLIKDKPRDLVNFARFLGEDIHESSNYEIVYGLVLKVAAQDPYTFNRKFNSKLRGYAERFYSAVALGLVSNEPDLGYTFDHISLGLSDEDAIQKLTEDPRLMKSLSMKVIESDSVVYKMEKEKGIEKQKSEIE
jgi:hypothetical protein